MKFYRYVIYKLYSWALEKKNDTPVANVVLTLTFVHYTQLFSIYIILLKIFPEISIFNKLNKIYIGLGLIIFAVGNYFMLYNKRRWASYLEEFKDEDASIKIKGNILVLIYLIGSILLLFMLAIILL